MDLLLVLTLFLSSHCFSTLSINNCNVDSWIYPVDGVYNTSSDIREGILNVHLIPHTHDDPGWRKTVDQYYYGSKRNIGGEGVQYILDNVVDELLKNPDRRFMYVEQSFFTRWWNEQSSKTKKVVRKLVKEGRLDLSVNGGWCMHDEAATHYTAMIDQTTLGHRFLKQEFNVTPRIGWQIDPFGHSATQASLLSAGVGFDALYFARIDFQDFGVRMKNSNMEFIWRSGPSQGKQTEVFTGVLQRGYGPPEELSFENGAEPIMDDRHLHDNNICEKINQIIQDIQDMAKHIKGNHIFIPLGNDFNYQNARMQFKNIDKLIHYANQDGRVNMFYSTLSKYTKAKHGENLTFQVKNDDFFPYGSAEHAYWSGYFSSRPTLKRYLRVANGFLQAARQLEVYSTKKTIDSKLGPLAKAIGLAQHHDAISGTEKQEVAWDYALRVAEGMTPAEKQVESILNDVVDATATPIEFCWLANISICETSQKSESFRVIIYNPLAYEGRRAYVRVPIEKKDAIVQDTWNNIIPSQVVPVTPTPFVNTGAKYNLVFEASGKSLAISQYHVSYKPTDNRIDSQRFETVPVDRILRNQYLEVSFCQHGHLKSLKRISQKKGEKNLTISLHHDFAYYTSYFKNGEEASGAYVFRPESSNTTVITDSTNSSLKFTYGEVVQEASRKLSNWTSVTYRLYAESPLLEVEWTVGEIPIADNKGKEVISRFTSDIQSEATCYTDSNGREFMKRQRNFRPSWNVSLAEPVAGNYFPITTCIYIKDKEKQLSILTDRAQGAASLKDGEIEIMIHRRLLHDDNKGVDEALNERETSNGKLHGLVAKGTFYLSLDKLSDSAKQVRQGMDEIFNSLLVGYKEVKENEIPAKVVQKEYTFRNSNSFLPQVSLQTLELLDESTVLLRLAHKYALNEDTLLSLPAEVKITDYFPEGSVSSYKEVSLSANQPISEVKPLKFLAADKSNIQPTTKDSKENPNVILLSPLEIKTFIVKIKDSSIAEQ